MTSVPPTHPPAAPETEGDLAKALRDAIWAAFDSSERLERCTRQDATALGVAVERIVAERVRVVEGERDAARVVEAYEREQHAGWVRFAAHEIARAESAEAAHEALRKGIEALADWCPSPWLETRLRALLAGGEER